MELDALFLQSLKLQEAYNTILSKVTPKLIHDLFARLQKNPHIKQPIYMIEIFTKETKRKDKGTIDIGDIIAYRHGLHFCCQEVTPYRNQNKV